MAMIGRLFLFYTNYFRRCLVTAVRLAFRPIRLAVLMLEYRYSGDCKPLRSNEQLLNFHRLPLAWTGMVESIATRAPARYLGTDYESFVPSAAVDETNRPKVFVCHDLAGNYRGDRYINGSTKWDDYRFYHWAGIDMFCYFSHEYVTIPTLSWINAAHKHGVQVLGTIIVENASGRIVLEQILQSEEYMRSVADALVLIAQRCNFEGWLLNVECDLNSGKIPMLRDFVEYLTLQMHRQVPHGVVIWYDSIIASGQLLWQNELNVKNKLFFDACDGILINYTWNEESLKRTEALVNGDPEIKCKIFFGIDVFGRGQKAKFETAQTLRSIVNHSFSVGIFAPGWTFETCTEFGINIHTTNGTDICNNTFIDRNNRFWAMLWQFMATTGPNQLPFYTSFCLGSGRRRYRDGILVQPPVSWINMAKQSLQPSVPVSTIQRSFDEAYTGGSCIKVLRTEHPKRLFVVDFKCTNDIIVSYAHKAIVDNESLCILLDVVDDISGRYCRLECGNGVKSEDILPNRIYSKPLHDQNLQEALILIDQRHENNMPATSINGWSIRYFYLSFDDSIMARITDVGIHVRHGDGAYLGAIHIHEGMKQNNELRLGANVTTVSKDDFKQKSYSE